MRPSQFTGNLEILKNSFGEGGSLSVEGDVVIRGNLTVLGGSNGSGGGGTNISGGGGSTYTLQPTHDKVLGGVWIDTASGLEVSTEGTNDNPAGKLSINAEALAEILVPILNDGENGSEAFATENEVEEKIADAVRGEPEGYDETKIYVEGEKVKYSGQFYRRNENNPGYGDSDGNGRPGGALANWTVYNYEKSRLENAIEKIAPVYGDEWFAVGTEEPAAYDSSIEYQAGAVVKYYNKYYKRNDVSLGQSNVSPDLKVFWEEVEWSKSRFETAFDAAYAVKASGESEIDFDEIENYDITKTYYEGDLVKYNGKYFRHTASMNGTNGVDPSGTMILNGGPWEEIFPPPELATTEYVDKQFSTSTVKGAWSDSIAYNEGDIVTNGSNYYRRTGNNQGVLGIGTWNTDLWEQIEEPEDSGFIKAFNKKFPGAFKEAFDEGIEKVVEAPEEYDNSKTYNEGEVVSYNGYYYVKTSVVAAAGTAPTVGLGAVAWQRTTWALGEAVNDCVGDALKGIAPEAFQFGVAYDNDIVSFEGKYYEANGSSEVGPVTHGWPVTTMIGWIKERINAAKGTIKRAIANANSQYVDLDGNNGVISIAFDNANPNIVHQATQLNSYDSSVLGQNIIEFELIYKNEQAASSLSWNNQNVTWIKGSAADLTAGRHLLKMRIIPQLEMNVPGAILAEYICELPNSFE